MATNLLRQFVPLCELTEDNLLTLARKTPVEILPMGKTLFKKGEEDNYTYYLLSGELSLRDGSGQEKRIVGGTAPTRFPVDHHRPRQNTAFALTEIKFFRIDNDMLDVLLTWDQNASYLVSEIEAEEDTKADWMTKMLHSEIFHRIPPSNIQQVFMRMEAKLYKTKDTVIRQNDEGDFYYFIKEGRVLITHITKNGKTVKLAELSAGSGFGEEALISDNRRNATVTMLTDGVLMCLSKPDFVELLKAPVVQSVDYATVKEMVKDGAVLLDVRLESEYKHAHLPGSINLPLYLLRSKARELDKTKRYIVCCDSGGRSSSAAFLLSERGYHGCYLEQGLRGLAAANSARSQG